MAAALTIRKGFQGLGMVFLESLLEAEYSDNALGYGINETGVSFEVDFPTSGNKMLQTPLETMGIK